jgi:hypothetical protein
MWVVSVTPRQRFSPGERTPGSHCTGGWVGPRAGLDTEARGKILCPCRGSNPDRPVVQPVVRHYADWANPAPVRHLNARVSKSGVNGKTNCDDGYPNCNFSCRFILLTSEIILYDPFCTKRKGNRLANLYYYSYCIFLVDCNLKVSFEGVS